MNHKVFPGRNGLPNNVAFELYNDTQIVCISDEPLEATERKVVQILLGIDWKMGFNGELKEERDVTGKYITTWTYLGPDDADWR